MVIVMFPPPGARADAFPLGYREPSCAGGTFRPDGEKITVQGRGLTYSSPIGQTRHEPPA